MGLKDQLMGKVKENYETRDRGGVQAKNYLKIPEDTSILRLQSGKNAIDIIPFKHGTDLFKGAPKGTVAYMLDIYAHKNFNPMFDKAICPKKTLGKPCPICERRSQLQEVVCERRSQLQEVDKEKYEEEINAYKPKRRFIANAINLKENEDDEHNGEIQILDEVYFFFGKELIEEACADDAGDPVDFVTPDEGKSIFFRATDEKLGKATFHKFKSFTFEDREEAYDESIIDDAYSLDELLVIPSYEELEAMLDGTEVKEEDEDEPEDAPEEVVEPEAKPVKKKGKKPVKKVKKPEPEPEEDEEEDDEDEPEDDDSERCEYGKTFGKDCDLEDEDCLDCRKNHKDTFKECLVESV